MQNKIRRAVAAVLATAMLVSAYAIDAQAKTRLDLPAQPLVDTLKAIASQSNINIFFEPRLLTGLHAPPVSGDVSPEDALAHVLRGSNLTFSRVDENTVRILPVQPKTGDVRSSAPIRLSQSDGRSQSQDQSETQNASQGESAERSAQAEASGNPRASAELAQKPRVAVPEVLVTGNRTLNIDIARSRDDSQPYVIYDREAIEQSGAPSVEAFLKQRLPMNATALSTAQYSSVSGATGTVNLRGLGNSQTLILVDGHRIAEHYQQGNPSQSDLNGIPISAIDRIEVLPTTASGIYGGGATGGVVNIILKRNYTGMEVTAGYENTFDMASATRRFDMNGGLSLNGGRTSLSFAGSYLDNERMGVGERNFVQRSREKLMANNPAALGPPNAPPLGATPNIRSAVAGQNLTLDVGNTPLNSQFTSIPAGYGGTSTDNGLALLANAGRYNLNLADTSQTSGARQSLLQDPTSRSLMVTVRQEFHPRVHAFMEAATNSIDTVYQSTNFAITPLAVRADAPNNPFQQNILVTVPTSEGDILTTTSSREHRLFGGVILQLPWAWKMDVDYLWARSKYSFVSTGALSAATTAAIANGTIDVLRDTAAFPLGLDESRFAAQGWQTPIVGTMKETTLRFAGPVGRLPAGQPIVSLSLQHREQDYSEATQFIPSSASTFFFPSRSQSVDNVYAEVRVPIVSAPNRVPGIRELELQIAGRRDEYTVNGVTSVLTNPTPTTPIERTTGKSSSNNPTLGLRWEVTRDVMLRASYGTGFLPPLVTQVLPTPGGLTQTVFDPLRGGTPVQLGPSTWNQGGNPSLTPEESESVSAGVVLTPRWVPDLRMSVDYTNIRKTDNILSMSVQGVLENETYLPGRVQRGANLPGDPAGWAGPVTYVDASLANLSRGEVEAWDVALDYRLDTESRGAFDFFMLGTWQPHYKTQVTPNAPVQENAGVTYAFPVKLKANAGLTWSWREWTLGWTMRYIDSYLVESPTSVSYATTLRSQGSERVPSQSYHDLFGSYRFSEGFLSGAELQAGIRNVFDKEPPFDARNALSFNYSPFGDPRLASYRLAIKWSF